MSGGVDDRVVQLKFDNKQFEQASAQSMSTLDKLKKSLDFKDANKSLGGLQKTAGSFNLGSMATTIEGISTKFLAMGTIGVTALVQLTQQGLQTGAMLAKALTIDPVQSGFAEYQTNLNSIQTILANTQAAGSNLKDVNKALDELNTYSDKTIYNFSEMARNIGTFTAAGVALKPATAAIKGIANLAALSGSNSQQASTAMYQLSQAIAAGKISLMDWNSVVNAGMGGTVFQRALAQTAVKMGTIKESAVKLKGPMKNVTIAGLSFRESISDPKVGGWLTSGVLTKTLAHFTADLTDAQLAAEGFSATEIKAIQAQAKTAMAAASQVKTISQAFDVAKETAGSGWTKTWSIIFGDFEVAKKDMTSFSNFMNDIINKNADARNKMLGEWAKFGGRTAAIDALKNALKALTMILDPIKKAWASVFPPSTGKDLADLTKKIRDFFGNLIIGQETANKIGYVFKGFFTVLKIGKNILSGVIGFVKDMFSIFTAGSGEASGGILDFAWNISNMIQRLDYFLTSTNAIPAFFDRLYNSVGPTVAKIRDFTRSIGEAVGGALGKLPALFGRLQGAISGANDQGLTPMEQTTSKLKDGWTSLTTALQGALSFFQNFGATVKDAFAGGGGFAEGIQKNLEKVNWPLIFKTTLATGFVAGVGLAIKAIWTFLQIFKQFYSIGNSISGAFNQLQDVLKSYQKEIRARTILFIAAAILALALSMKVLASIPVPSLIVSIGAMKLLFMMLNQSMESIGKIADGKSIGKVPVVAASLFLIAGAMVVFALAIKLMSMIPVGDAIKGIAMMGSIILGIVGVAKLMEKAQGDILRFSAGLLIMGNAMIVFAAAIFLFQAMDPGTFFKGASMIVGFISALGIAMRLLPKQGEMLKASAGLLLIAIAMNMMIIPIQILGNMDFGSLVKGIGGIAILLAVMAIALNAMEGTLPGAAAMLVASVALVMFGQAIQTLANVGFGSVILGILGIVIAMAAIAGAAFLLAPAAIPMAIFGAALVILGTGFALLGGGALAFATAMSIIVSVMSLGMPILEDTIKNFIALIPLLAEGFKVFLIEFSNAFTLAIPAMVNSVTQFILAILISIQTLVPQFQKTFSAFIKAGLETIASFYADFITAGLTFIRKLLKGIADNLPEIIKSGTNIIITLIKGFGKAAQDILTAAGDTLIKFMEGLTKWINDNKDRINQAGRDLAGAIISGFIGGITNPVSGALEAVGGFFGNIIKRAQSVLDSHSPSRVFIKLGKDVTAGFIIGVVQGKQGVIDSMNTITEAIKKAKDDSAAHIKDLKAKLKDAEADKKKSPADLKKIAALKAELKVAEAEQKKLDAAYLTISKQRKAQEAQLISLGGQYDVITKKLDEARQKYSDAVKARDDFAASITEKYSVLPTLDATTSLDEYFDAIRKATEDNIKFKATLDQLRNLGLDDTSYKKFLEQGTAAQPFLDQLLASGGSTIAELNKIDGTLADSATSLGKSASEALYQAGVDSAKGLVDGLTANLQAITDKMKSIGKAIADELKKELGIKSPSKVMAEVGKFTVQGLAKGLDDNAKVIDISSKQLGRTAIDSLKESMSGMSDVIQSDINLEPTIAPVLDLDAFRKDAAGINDILAPKNITPSVSTLVAGDISAKSDAQVKALQEQAAATAGTVVNLEQNNYSPKALSSAEIYRQTRNQLSVVKEALAN